MLFIDVLVVGFLLSYFGFWHCLLWTFRFLVLGTCLVLGLHLSCTCLVLVLYLSCTCCVTVLYLFCTCFVLFLYLAELSTDFAGWGPQVWQAERRNHGFSYYALPILPPPPPLPSPPQKKEKNILPPTTPLRQKKKRKKPLHI